MMHGREKSDPAIVVVKPTNKAGQLAAELVERRAGTKGNVSQQSTRRAQDQISVMADQAIVANDVSVDPKKRGPRGNYAVSPRVAKALTQLASGECKTQGAACAAAGLTPRALTLALKRPSTKAYMQEVVLKSLGLSALKAAKRVDELLNSSNEMVGFNASHFCAGSWPADCAAGAFWWGGGQYRDWRLRGRVHSRPSERPVCTPVRPAPRPLLIDGSAVEAVQDRAER